MLLETDAEFWSDELFSDRGDRLEPFRTPYIMGRKGATHLSKDYGRIILAKTSWLYINSGEQHRQNCWSWEREAGRVNSNEHRSQGLMVALMLHVYDPCSVLTTYDYLNWEVGRPGESREHEATLHEISDSKPGYPCWTDHANI